MSIEIRKGTVAAITQAEDKKASTCRVGEHEVELNRDLVDKVNVGDEIAIAGHTNEQGIKALALNNLSLKKITSTDPTNLVLAMGASGFAFFVFFVLGAQNFSAGIMSLAALNIALSLVGLVGTGIAIRHLQRLRQAVAKCKYI